MRTLSWNRFDGGMTNDPRDPEENIAQIVMHMDNYTLPYLISPHPDNDATASDRGSNAFDTFRIQQFLFANFLTTPTFYGLGVSGTTVPEIYKKTSVADGTAWTGSNHTGDYASLTALGAGPKAFTLYHEGDPVYLYGLDGGGWWKYGDITATPTWTRAVYTTTTFNICPPIVHSKDDIMYSAGGQGTTVSNRIIRNNAGSWDTPLVFGIYVQIPSICEFGNYLAIAANNPDATSTVFLWDRDSSLTTVSEKIDWGSGQLKFIQTIGGTLVGCSIEEPSSALSLNPTVVFKYYNGTTVIEFARFTTTAATVYPFKQVYNSMAYFLAEMTINGVNLRGIWKIVKTPSGRFTVSFDRQPRLDDTVTAGKLYGFLRTGDYFHIACANVSDSDKYIVTKTGNTYGTTPTYRTTINPEQPERYRASAGARSESKQLMAINISTPPLVSGQGGLLYYRVDGGSWINVANLSTSLDATLIGTVAHEYRTDINGTSFTSGREYEFRFDPQGGTPMAEIRYKYETLETLL